MRNRILIISTALLLTVVAGALVAVQLFISGAGAFDDWVMRQVLGIAQTYIVPRIEFDDFNFQAPGTVIYKGVAFVAPDGTQVLDAGEMEVTLGNIPKKGSPVIISGITIRDGALRLIAAPDDPDVRFKGLAPFVKKNNYKKQESLPREVRLSETLELRSIALENAGIVYDLGDGSPPMRLDGMTFTMNINPVEENGAVWHTIDLNVDRGDVFSMILDGRIDLDALAVDLRDFGLRVDVGSESVAALPPQLQQLLAQHDAQGLLEIKLQGSGSASDWRNTNLTGSINIDRFNLGIGEYRAPIETASIPIKVEDGTGMVGPASCKLMDGDFNGFFSVDLTRQGMPSDVEWSLSGIDLLEMLRSAAPEGEPPKIAGILSTYGSVSMDLASIPESIDGRGQADIVEGRLVNFPGVVQINNLLNVVASRQVAEHYTDRFHAEFTLNDRGVQIDKSELSTRAVLARGAGMVYYTSALDLQLNAGPIEKLQSMLGRVGKAIGSITDQLMTYHVTGTVKDPKVTVRALGIGF